MAFFFKKKNYQMTIIQFFDLNVLSYQYKNLAPLYTEGSLYTCIHNYPKCFYSCNHHTDKQNDPCIRWHLAHNQEDKGDGW